jgi:hypothetical protein
MGQVAFIWDLEDNPDGNYWHICVEGHGVTWEEVAYEVPPPGPSKRRKRR